MSQDLAIDSETLTITYAQALGFVGFGNYDQLFELFLGMAPKILIKQFVSFGVMDAEADEGYGSLEQELIEQMGLCDLTGCDECTCA